MENDSIRSTGANTLVDMWIDGKMRAICVSQGAIGAFLGFDGATGMSDRDRREFVRTHLPLLVTSAKARLRDNPTADTIVLDAGHITRPDGTADERRKGDRRKTDRRKSDTAKPERSQRRRGDRRQGQRRAQAPKGNDG